MTEAELLTIVGNKDCPLLQHANMIDCAFWPITLTLTKDTYNLYGYWYSNVFEDIMGDSFGNPLKETIKIKKEDLASWQTKNTKAE